MVATRRSRPTDSVCSRWSGALAAARRPSALGRLRLVTVRSAPSGSHPYGSSRCPRTNPGNLRHRDARSYERVVAVAGLTVTSTAGECGTDRRQRERQVDRRAQRRLPAGAGETVRVCGHDPQGRTASPAAPACAPEMGRRRRATTPACHGRRRGLASLSFAAGEGSIVGGRADPAGGTSAASSNAAEAPCAPRSRTCGECSKPAGPAP
jgi:hypothetical protein